MRTGVRLAIACGVVLGVGSARSQGLTPLDATEAARFNRLIGRVEGAGYGHALPVAHGSGALESMFVFTATTRSDSGVLLAVVEPAGNQGRPLILETERNPAELAVYGVTMTSFLDMRDLYDIEVTHHPHRLEMSYAFSTHHVVRRTADMLSAVCEFAGNSSSSYSKGIGSHTTSRQVRVERVLGRVPQFVVRITSRSTERAQSDASPHVETADSTTHYQLDPSGSCREIKPAPH